jgi:NAD(P)-dependent dehydrogenase (short-subunit alcohol dehydrogenase family)
MGKLDGKVALISGGARGQGAAEAETFAREGAKVVFGDVRDVEGQKVEAAIRAAGGEAIYVHLDVTDEVDWQDAVETAVTRYGKLDILINNAGIVIPRVPIEERTADEWDRVMAVNAKGVFLGTKCAIPAMRRAGGGSIVNISSVAGLQGVPGLSGYCASKGGVRLFTKAVALECAQARNGVRVNSIHPGGIETPLWAKMASDGAAPSAGDPRIPERMEAARSAALAATPLGIVGSPADIAAGVVYLASDEARFVTGSELVIDGGASAG